MELPQGNIINKNTRHAGEGRKGIGLIIFAVIIALVFLYFAYTTFVRKDNFLLQRLGGPEDKGSVQQITFPVQKNIVTGSQVDILEQNIRENMQLQELEVFGNADISSETSGNRNPFKPFSQGTVETPQKPLLQLEEIEKPLPRVTR